MPAPAAAVLAAFVVAAVSFGFGWPGAAPVLAADAGDGTSSGASGSTVTIQATSAVAQAPTRLANLPAYRFRTELTGSFARRGPVRGQRLVVTGTVIEGIGRLVRFDASGSGAEPSVTYLERGNQAWLLLPTGRWLSVVPDDNPQPGTFTSFFPDAFYTTYDWPWINGARLLTARSASVAANPPASRVYIVEPGDLLDRANAAGFNGPTDWSLRISVATTGALESVTFSGRTTDAGGRTNAFSQSLVVFPLRRATLPNPR